MRSRWIILISVSVGLTFSGAVLAQTAKHHDATSSEAKSATPVDFTGVWKSVDRKGEPRDAHGAWTGGVVDPEVDQGDQYTYWHSPYPLQPWAEEKFNYNKDPYNPYTHGRSEVNPYDAECSPQGPTVDWQFQSWPFEIIQSPKRVLIMYERDHEIRQIWTDGRLHPKDFGHNWMGHSIGHWEGDTLVADTIGLNDLTWLDKAGHVHSDQLHLVERIQRAGDKLMLHMTFDDPKALTKPMAVFKSFQLMPNWEISENIICEDKLLGHAIPLK
jgi:hypothetical protein